MSKAACSTRLTLSWSSLSCNAIPNARFLARTPCRGLITQPGSIAMNIGLHRQSLILGLAACFAGFAPAASKMKLAELTDRCVNAKARWNGLKRACGVGLESARTLVVVRVWRGRA